MSLTYTPVMPTPKQLLLELSYPGDLAREIEALLAAGKSWRDIARDVAAKTGHPISHESLRQWYGSKKVAA